MQHIQSDVPLIGRSAHSAACECAFRGVSLRPGSICVGVVEPATQCVRSVGHYLRHGSARVRLGELPGHELDLPAVRVVDVDRAPTDVALTWKGRPYDGPEANVIAP